MASGGATSGGVASGGQATGGGAATGGTPGASCDLTPPPGIATEIDFETQVLPIFEKSENSCLALSCHGDTAPWEGVNYEVDLGGDMVPEASNGPLYVPCEPERSTLIIKASASCDLNVLASPGTRMPLAGANAGQGVSEDDFWVLYQWVAEGARRTYSADACDP